MIRVVFSVVVNGHCLSGLTSCCAVVMFTHNNIHCNDAIFVYSLLVHTVSLTTFIDVLHSPKPRKRTQHETTTEINSEASVVPDI